MEKSYQNRKNELDNQLQQIKQENIKKEQKNHYVHQKKLELMNNNNKRELEEIEERAKQEQIKQRKAFEQNQRNNAEELIRIKMQSKI